MDPQEYAEIRQRDKERTEEAAISEIGSRALYFAHKLPDESEWKWTFQMIADVLTGSELVPDLEEPGRVLQLVGSDA